MATTSLYSSTTHSTVASRRGSRQIRHCSSSETLKQVLQNRTRALTSSRTSARRRTSTGSDERRWNAIRCALLGPTPGSRPSSSMRSWMTPSYMARHLHPGQAEAAHPLGQRTHLLLGQLGRRARGVADGRDDQVLQALDVVRVHRLRVDLDGEHLT